MLRRPAAALALLVTLAVLAPAAVAPPSYAFSVVIYQLAPSAGPLVSPLPLGCGVVSLPSPTYLRVECTPPSSGFTCDFTLVTVAAGLVTVNASGPSVAFGGNWVPGESVTGSTGCSGGPTIAATANLPGFAYAGSNAVNFAFPWSCEATFSALATGVVQCDE